MKIFSENRNKFLGGIRNRIQLILLIVTVAAGFLRLVLSVNEKTSLNTMECSGCMDCINACPAKNTLEWKTWGLRFPLKTVQVGLVIMLTFFSVVYVSTITGHWQSRVSDQEFRMLLRIIDTPDIVHPSVNMKKRR
jgi:ferredoxin